MSDARGRQREVGARLEGHGQQLEQRARRRCGARFWKTDHDAVGRDDSQRSEAAIPRAEDGSEVGIGLAALDRVVRPVQVRRDEDATELASPAVGHPHVGVV